MQLPATKLDDKEEPLGKADSLAAEALAVARDQLIVGDVLGAERTLIDALVVLDEAGAMGAAEIRASSEYNETLELLQRVFGGPSTESSPSSGGDAEKDWRLSAEVKVDPETLGFPKQKREHAGLQYIVKIFYRTYHKRVEIKLECELPTPEGGPLTPEQVLLGWSAMFEETQLWETWNPVIARGGAVSIGEQSKHRKMWYMPVSVFFIKEVQMQDVHIVYDHESGSYSMLIDGVSPGTSLWKEHPHPAGYTPDTKVMKAHTTIKPRRDATSFQIHIDVTAPFNMPETFIRWSTAWLLPEATRRMLKSVAKCASGAGPHAGPIARDRLGTYAESRRLVQSGVALSADESSARGSEQSSRRRSLLLCESLQGSVGSEPDNEPEFEFASEEMHTTVHL